MARDLSGERRRQSPERSGARRGAEASTPYGGLLPVATMLEKLGFKKLVEETLSVHRIPRAMFPLTIFGWFTLIPERNSVPSICASGSLLTSSCTPDTSATLSILLTVATGT